MSVCADHWQRRSAGLVAAALTLTLAACGGEDATFKSVEQYINRANAVQAAAGPSLARANRDYAAFSRNGLAAADAPGRLAVAERAIRSTRTQLAQLRPPAAARTLHRRLLRMYDLEAGLARETTALGRYLPAARRSLGPLSRINARLQRALRESQSPTAQAQALSAFARGLHHLGASLRELSPPPLVRPTHRAQVAKIARTERLATELRTAVGAGASRRVALILERFRRLNAGSSQSRELQAHAIRAYQGRYRALQHAAAELQRERNRLERKLT